MRRIVVEEILGMIDDLSRLEVAPKLKLMNVDETRDRLRIIFEFEMKGKATSDTPPVIKDAVEIRHRRPWE